jgi:diguanylate cyclase (GGDEF)-like protein
MPGMNGLELCRKVRGRADESYVYIILLTAKDQTENIVEALSAGADDYIVKSPNPDELQARLRAGKRIIDLQEKLIKNQKVLEAQASTDSLTGILNRPAIFKVLRKEIARAKRNKKPVAIAMADLDGFKTINDTYGHLAGDAVLQEFTARTVSVLRPYDSVGRYGGEEFLIILPGLDEKVAKKVMERIRVKICENAISHSGKTIPLSVSTGVAVTNPSDDISSESLIYVADQALYKAKSQGKNCVVIGKRKQSLEKILVIDDDKRIRTTIRKVLETKGYEVLEADNGKIGIDLYKKEPAKIVITDMLMPVADGIESITELKKLSPTQKIIAMSGGGQINGEYYLDMAKKMNVTNILPKPFGKKDLLDAVQKSLQA